jgi:hypothetical protein
MFLPTRVSRQWSEPDMQDVFAGHSRPWPGEIRNESEVAEVYLFVQNCAVDVNSPTTGEIREASRAVHMCSRSRERLVYAVPTFFMSTYTVPTPTPNDTANPNITR